MGSAIGLIPPTTHTSSPIAFEKIDISSEISFTAYSDGYYYIQDGIEVTYPIGTYIDFTDAVFKYTLSASKSPAPLTLTWMGYQITFEASNGTRSVSLKQYFGSAGKPTLFMPVEWPATVFIFYGESPANVGSSAYCTGTFSNVYRYTMKRI